MFAQLPPINSNSFHGKFKSDPNPTLDVGCSYSIGSVSSASKLAESLGQLFEIEPMDMEPFYHGFGENCSDMQLTIGLWNCKLKDVNDSPYVLKFYLV